MGDSGEPPLQRAISAIVQVDPIVKLLQQVRLGRIRAEDPALRAVTEFWLEAYEKAVRMDGLTRADLCRLDPAPRLAVLIDAGVLTPDHPGVTSLSAAYDRAMTARVE